MNSSRSLYRTSSTGGLNRVGSASSTPVRAGSAGPENRILREQINRLQNELLYSKAETQKVTDQLNCVISLIKRAWKGDNTANVHLANIIGMAPPDLEISSGVNDVIISAKPKSSSINNWAVLTIGILNREYKRLERELEAKQRIYLQRRQDFLEEQLILNRDQILHLQSSVRQTSQGCPSRTEHVFAPVKSAPQGRHCTSPVDNLQPDLQVAYGRQNPVTEKISVSRPPSSGLQRKWSAKGRRPKEVKQESNLTWADLVIEPSSDSKINKNTSSTMDGLYRLPAQTSQPVEPEIPADHDEDRMYLAYDDPRRYAQRGLFDVDNVLGPEALSQRKRPLNEQLKQTDSVRARPKSAVTKRERPLKYETTRPVSANIPSKSKMDMNHLSNNKRQVKSAKARQYVPMDQTSYGVNQASTDKIHNDLKNSARDTQPSQGESGDQAKDDKLQKSVKFQEIKQAEIQKLLSEDPELAQLLQLDVTRPECIDEFDDDLKDMEHREKDFAKRAVELQKKLGIDKGGILYPDL